MTPWIEELEGYGVSSCPNGVEVVVQEGENVSLICLVCLVDEAGLGYLEVGYGEGHLEVGRDCIARIEETSWRQYGKCWRGSCSIS